MNGEGRETEGFQGGIGSEVLVGLDAVSLYPSIEKKVAMEMCRNAAREVEIEVQNVNYMEATRFLALTMDDDEIRESRLGRIMPRMRKKASGRACRKLRLTTANSLEATTNDQNQWEWPEVNLSKEEKVEIFSKTCLGFQGIFS